MWNKSQIIEIAKRVVKARPLSWWEQWSPTTRQTFVNSDLFDIIAGQDGPTVKVEDITALQTGVQYEIQENHRIDLGLVFNRQVNPRGVCCPRCASTNVRVSVAEWHARSEDVMDRNNTANLEEHQCSDCAYSFWT